MGRGCGPHSNFSSIVEHVIDDKDTWRNEYPLGRMVLQDRHHPLTLQLVLDGCRRNEPLFVVLQLASRHNLERIIAVNSTRMVNVNIGTYLAPKNPFWDILTLLFSSISPSPLPPFLPPRLATLQKWSPSRRLLEVYHSSLPPLCNCCTICPSSMCSGITSPPSQQMTSSRRGLQEWTVWSGYWQQWLVDASCWWVWSDGWVWPMGTYRGYGGYCQ